MSNSSYHCARLFGNHPNPYNAAMMEKEVPESALGEFQTLLDIVERLRAPGGCPWDREQTHESLKRNLVEETYETVEAIDQGNPQLLAEELGDLLVQVAFHSDIAREAGQFQASDVLTQINRKLVRRHPHVFGDTTVDDAREVERNWERIKAEERRERGERKSVVDGIPNALPALAYAQLMQERAARSGFEWEDISGVLDKISEEAQELREASTPEELTHELGDLLFATVNLARWLNLQAEDALRQGNRRFHWRYTKMEELAQQRGLDFPSLPLDDKEVLWQEAKRLENG
jgi:tetrapyrrole methylase family protein/MazG family protein